MYDIHHREYLSVLSSYLPGAFLQVWPGSLATWPSRTPACHSSTCLPPWTHFRVSLFLCYSSLAGAKSESTGSCCVVAWWVQWTERKRFLQLVRALCLPASLEAPSQLTGRPSASAATRQPTSPVHHLSAPSICFFVNNNKARINIVHTFILVYYILCASLLLQKIGVGCKLSDLSEICVVDFSNVLPDVLQLQTVMALYPCFVSYLFNKLVS